MEDLTYAHLNLTSNFEAVWGQYGLKIAIYVNSQLNIVFFSPEIETDAKNGYWPKNRPIIKIYNFDPNIMKVGENINITRV